METVWKFFSVDHTALGDVMDLWVRIPVATVQLPAEFRRSSLLLSLTSTVFVVSSPTVANPKVPTSEAPVNPDVPLLGADINDSQNGKKPQYLCDTKKTL